MSDAVCDDVDREPFHVTARLVPSEAPTHYTWTLESFGEPPPVFLSIQVNRQIHPCILLPMRRIAPHHSPLDHTGTRAMPSLYTVGHSTRPREEFSSILQAFAVRILVDIRTIPRSRRNPQYNQDTLPKWLAECGIGYRHCPDLGGLRHPRKDSINRAWRNDSFRGFADYMQTPEFARAIDGLIVLASEQTATIMCAEAVPWRCHRSLIADALAVRGVAVQHIMSAHSAKTHELTSWAQVDGIRVTYPAAQRSLL